MIDTHHALLATVVMAVITFVLRTLPFVATGFLRRHRIIRELGRFLPAAILALLFIHSLLGFVQQDLPSVGLMPVLVATASTLGLHLLFNNALISIFTGTGLYVLLRNAELLWG